MIRLLFAIGTCCLMACQEQANSKRIQQDTNLKPLTGYTWQKILDSAVWAKSYNFQLFDIRDTLWTLHPDGTWFSSDGYIWNKSPLPNTVRNQAFLDYVFYKDALNGLGHLEGNIEQFNFSPVINRTENLKDWETLSTASTLPERFFYHPFVFKDKIWLIGGEDKRRQYADIWNSDDGVIWTRQKDSLPFGKRSRSQIVLLGNKLFLLNNDVWSSTDGLNWQQEAAEIIKGEEVFGYNAIVWDEKIWLLGCNRNGKFSSQVLVSGDGKNWLEQQAPWTPRGGVAAAVHNNAIYITGGKYGGTPNQPEFIYSNDVWKLSKSPTP